jgi:alkylation response protein AidB-like acyl-CoA dehydrogenase
MDFEFSVEQELLRDSVRRFLDDHSATRAVRAVAETPEGYDAAAWKGLCGIGAAGLLVPEDLGGAGMGMVDAAVVLEELGRAVHPSPYRASAIGAASLLALAPDGAVAPRWLPAIADGSAIATVAFLEPGQRIEWRAPKTRVVEGALTGAKAHVEHAQNADLLLVVARDDAGLGVFAVVASAGNITIEPLDAVDITYRAATVRFDGAAATRIADGDLTALIAATVDRLGVASVVDGVGAAARALDMAVEYANQREQFGHPIGRFQAVQHLCADMLHAVEVARAGSYYACWAADDADPIEAHRAATMAQAWAAAELPPLGGNVIQVFGGIGFTWEHDAHLYFKRVLSTSLGLGSADDHLAELARLTLD